MSCDKTDKALRFVQYSNMMYIS